MNRSPIERSSGYIEKQFVVAGNARLWKRRWSATKASPGDVVSSISHVHPYLKGSYMILLMEEILHQLIL